MKSDYYRKSLSIEVMNKVIRHKGEMFVHDLQNAFPGLEKEVYLTVDNLIKGGQLQVQENKVRITEGNFKLKDFNDYFK